MLKILTAALAAALTYRACQALDAPLSALIWLTDNRELVMMATDEARARRVSALLRRIRESRE